MQKNRPIYILDRFFSIRRSARIGSMAQKWAMLKPGAIDANMNLAELNREQYVSF